MRLPWQFAGLADRNKSRLQLQRQRCTENESRASAASTLLMPALRQGTDSWRMVSRSASGLARIGVMSRNIMPGLGKSGTARTQERRFIAESPLNKFLRRKRVK